MNKRRDMIEGRQAFDRFRDAMKAIVSVPKSALPTRKAKKAKRKKST